MNKFSGNGLVLGDELIVAFKVLRIITVEGEEVAVKVLSLYVQLHIRFNWHLLSHFQEVAMRLN